MQDGIPQTQIDGLTTAITKLHRKEKRVLAVAGVPLSGEAVTPGGLVVPAHVVDAGGHGEGTDLAGRRRVVLMEDDMKILDRAINMMGQHGFGLIFGCRILPETAYVHSETGAPTGRIRRCGELLKPEGTWPDGTKDADWGYGCKCSRVHFRKVL